MASTPKKVIKLSAEDHQKFSGSCQKGIFSHPYSYRHPSSYVAPKPDKQSGANHVLSSESSSLQQSGFNDCPRIPYTYIDWNSALGSILTPLHNLLAPPAYPCLACGKIITDSAKGFPEICSSCYASIPWIRQPRCKTCGRPVGCPDCTRDDQVLRHFILNRSVVSYTPLMREWLARFKFRGDEALGEMLARMVGEGIRRMERELMPDSGRTTKHFFDAVTYVPVSAERMQERGFNQARSLAAEAAKVGKVPLLELLQRSRHTDKQSSKNRLQRLKEVHDIFIPAEDAEALVKSFLMKPESIRLWNGDQSSRGPFAPQKKLNVLLVDDVYTTGSTVNACSEVLQTLFSSVSICAEIYSLTWARS